jgi:hypothetical protein
MVFDPYGYDLTIAARQTPLTTMLGVLPGVPSQAQFWLWQGLTRAIEGALDLWERTPAGHKAPAPAFTVRHAGTPAFNQADLRHLTLEDWHRFTGLELCLTVEVLEALIWEETPVFREMLAEQCHRVGQLYSEMERRAGTAFALPMLCWELHLLRYRASPVLAPLIYQ